MQCLGILFLSGSTKYEIAARLSHRAKSGFKRGKYQTNVDPWITLEKFEPFSHSSENGISKTTFLRFINIWTVWKLQAWPISAWSVHLPPINVSPDKLLVTVHNLHFTMKAVLLLSVLASAFAAPDTRLYINYNLLSALRSPPPFTIDRNPFFMFFFGGGQT